MIRIISLICITTLLLGCGPAQVKRFSGFYQSDAHVNPNIDIVTDTIVISDIKGTNLGINSRKNSQAMTLVKESISEQLKIRGFKLNFVHQGNGTVFVFSDKQKYFESNDLKSTGKEFVRQMDTASSPWYSLEAQQFLRRLYTRSRVARLKQPRKYIVAKISHDEIPQFVKDLPSGRLLFVNTQSIDIGAVAKSKRTFITRSFLYETYMTGAFTTVGTNGALFSGVANYGGSVVDIAVFDVKSSQVVWHTGINDPTGKNPQLGGSYTKLDKIITELIKNFPMTNGQLLPQTENEEYSKSGSKRR